MDRLRFFHTLDIDDENEFTEVFPLGEKSFEDKVDKKEVFYRRNLKGKYKFINKDSENIFDYSFFYYIEHNPAERCKTRFIIVEEFCGGKWSIIHIGKFSMNDCDFDEDRCEIEVKVKEVDEYSCLKEHEGEKFNILTTGPIVSTSAPKPIPYEFITCRDDCTTVPCGVPDPSFWKLFYEYCSDYIPNTGEIESETNTKYAGTTLGMDHLMEYDGDNNFVFVSRTEDQFGPSFFDTVISKYNIATDTVSTIQSFNTDVVYSYAAGFETACILYNSGGQRIIKVYNTATGALVSTHNLSPFSFTFFELKASKNRSVMHYYNGSSHQLLMNITTIGTDGNGINNLEVNEEGILWHETFSDNVRFYRYSDSSNNIIDNVVGISKQQTNDDWIIYQDNSNNLYKFDIATLTKTLIISNPTDVKLGENFVFYRLAGDLYLHDLINGGVDILVSIGIDTEGLSLNDEFGVYSILNNLYLYDVVANTSILIDGSGPNTNETYISGGNVFYRDRNANKITSYNIFYGAVGLLNKSYSIGGTVNSFKPSAYGDIGFLEYSISGGSTVDDNYWFFSKAEINTKKVRIWFREIQNTVCLGGVPQIPSGGGWSIEEDNCATSGISKWKRLPPANPLSVGTVGESICVCDMSGCTTVQPPALLNPILIGPCENDGDCAYWLEPVQDISYTRGRILKNVIEALIQSACPNIKGVESNFFQWNPSIPSTINYVTGETNELMYLTIHQKSDVITPNSTEAATIGNIKWKEVTEFMRVMFEVYWYVDQDNVLHFEHISAIQNVVGLDLTSEEYNDWQKNNRRYSYDKSEMFKSQVFEFQEQENIDFVGFPIEYKDANGDFNICTNEENEELSLDFITTDIGYIQFNAGAIDLSGFVIFANDYDGVNYTVLQSIGKITGELITNAALGWSNLHKNYLRWNRILNEGYMNNIFQEFETVLRFKQQEKFVIPICCETNYKPYDFVKTSLGIGQVETATRDFKNNMLELKLKY